MNTGVDLSQFYDMFFDEAEELLTDMEQLLLGVDIEQPNIDDLNAIFRAAHSIKGGAGTFGCFEHLADTTHLLENVLDSIRKDELQLRKEMIDIFLEAKDVLTEQLMAYRNEGEPDQQAYDRICQQLRELALEANGAAPQPSETSEPQSNTHAGVDAEASVAPADPTTDAVFDSASSSSAVSNDATSDQSNPSKPESGSTAEHVLRVTLKALSESDAKALESEMAIMGSVLDKQTQGDALTLHLSTTASADDIEAVCCFIVNANQIDVQLVSSDDPAGQRAVQNDVVPTATDDTAVADAAPVNTTRSDPAPVSQTGETPASAPVKNPAAKTSKQPASAAVNSTLRVGVEKVDQIINLVGELVITQAMLVQTVQGMDPVLHDRLVNGVEHLERNARDLQEAVMSIRMMPMDYVFSRFPRVVRESASAMDKRIRLVTHGQATELDKSLIERIIDPLTHLVRNSIDHGIEKPEDRIRSGKEPEGVLTLSAQHSGGHIVIQVSDDGAGLNRERILAKAMAQGFPVNENTSDDELWQLIFAPGFSTAEKVTAISGRGVGMDVVRRNIQGMGGHIHLSSVAGKGTVTRIILPLTLAILDGMSVRTGDETFILPLSNVMESLQPEQDQVRQISDTERVLHVRGEYLPLIALHDVFDINGAETDITNAIAVILKAEEQRFALLVDHLVGQHQVVVKNLESNYRKIPGISAATILGDGSVALIVDVFALMRLTQTGTTV